MVNEVIQTWVIKSRTLKEWNVSFAHANLIELADDDNDISEEEVKASKPVNHTDIYVVKEEFAAQVNSFRTLLKE
jgi:hypothetical protein